MFKHKTHKGTTRYRRIIVIYIGFIILDNETKEIVCIINKIERGEDIIDDIIDYKALSKYYSNFKTINDLKNITIVE